MLKKSITYTTFDDQEVTEDFFFHLSKAAIVKLELTHKGGLQKALENIIAAEDGTAIIEEFDKILKACYGLKSEDGKRFIQNDEIWEAFTQTNAYDALFMEICTDDVKMADFIKAVVPRGLVDEAMAAEAQQKLKMDIADGDVNVRVVTKAELEAMSPSEFADLSTKIATGEVVIDDRPVLATGEAAHKG